MESGTIRFGILGYLSVGNTRHIRVLPIVASITEILKPEIKLTERIPKLLLRLELGVPSSIIELAKVLGRTLNRGEYLELLKREIMTTDQFSATDERILLEIFPSDKVEEIRCKIEQNIQEQSTKIELPEIPLYE